TFARNSGDGPAMLIRADDMGMSHGQNQAFQTLIESGMPVSVSVMFACPWWKQAVVILEEHPEVYATAPMDPQGV
ncbi:MAG: ChbG/HpnK family deacetylase, partial [Trueperaceae bacterium]